MGRASYPFQSLFFLLLFFFLLRWPTRLEEAGLGLSTSPTVRKPVRKVTGDSGAS